MKLYKVMLEYKDGRIVVPVLAGVMASSEEAAIGLVKQVLMRDQFKMGESLPVFLQIRVCEIPDGCFTKHLNAPPAVG